MTTKINPFNASRFCRGVATTIPQTDKAAEMPEQAMKIEVCPSHADPLSTCCVLRPSFQATTGFLLGEPVGRAQRTQASLTLAPSPPPSQVQTITGKTCQIQCHPEDTIGDLKATVRGLETTDDYHRAKGKVLPVHDNPKWQDMIHVIPGAEKPVQVTRFLQPTPGDWANPDPRRHRKTNPTP